MKFFTSSFTRIWATDEAGKFTDDGWICNLFQECLFSFLLVSGNQCVIRSAEFKLLLLNKAVLKNVLMCLNQTKGDVLEKEPTHR